MSEEILWARLITQGALLLVAIAVLVYAIVLLVQSRRFLRRVRHYYEEAGRSMTRTEAAYATARQRAGLPITPGEVASIYQQHIEAIERSRL